MLFRSTNACTLIVNTGSQCSYSNYTPYFKEDKALTTKFFWKLRQRLYRAVCFVRYCPKNFPCLLYKFGRPVAARAFPMFSFFQLQKAAFSVFSADYGRMQNRIITRLKIDSENRVILNNHTASFFESFAELSGTLIFSMSAPRARSLPSMQS